MGLVLSLLALVTAVPLIFLITCWDDPTVSVNGPYVMIYSWLTVIALALTASICGMVMTVRNNSKKSMSVAALSMSILTTVVGILTAGLFLFL